MFLLSFGFAGCQTLQPVADKLFFWKDGDKDEKEKPEQLSAEERKEVQRLQMIRRGKTELIVAVEQNNLSEVSRLARSGQSVNVVDNSGKTPLMYAAEACYVDIAHFLLQNNASVGARDVGHRSVLHFASLSDCSSLIRPIVIRGLDPDARDAFGRTPLHIAAEHHSANAIEILLELEANVHIRDNRGKTPIWLASNRVGFYEEPEIEEEVVDARDFTRRRSDGWPVYLKVPAQAIVDNISNAWNAIVGFDYSSIGPFAKEEIEPDDIRTFKLLLAAGARITDMDYSFTSAYDILQSRGEPEILALIQEYRQ